MSKEQPVPGARVSDRIKTAEVVAAQLRRQIVTGRLKPGDRLRPEVELQEEFGISRPTMREALRLLEAESLIAISRGKHGGARVRDVDVGSVSRQVGVLLQLQSTTLEDVWLARTIFEPSAARLLALDPTAEALEALRQNVEQERRSFERDPILYADLSAGFSLLIARHCGNQTVYLLVSLLFDVIRRQHENIAKRTLGKARVVELRKQSIETREDAISLMAARRADEVHDLWAAHLQRVRDLVLEAYDGSVTIDILDQPVSRKNSPGVFRRPD
jgi:GntR family transcriptional repressor for pyruvate dehydrogenase complex